MVHKVLICLVFLLLSVFTHGQMKNNERDSSIAEMLAGRMSKATFENEFSRGRCPHRFYQLGNECVFFSNDGKSHSWKRASTICAGRIAQILQDSSASNNEQPNMQPTNGVRQLVLNTPEKTDILRALFRDYQEQNFAVQLPWDYQLLVRCNDGQDDKWPQFCTNAAHNSSCFETVSFGPNDICLREVDCNSRYLRLACEFTLPGSPELTSSTFRSCAPLPRGRSRRLPRWALITIIVGSSLIGLILLIVIFALICKSKRNTVPKKRPFPEPRPQPEKIIRLPPRREDRTDEPMLTGISPTAEPDSGYLAPRSLPTDVTANT